jgi:hypothetical protein
LEVGKTVIATECQEVKVSGLLEALQSPGHEEKVSSATVTVCDE